MRIIDENSLKKRTATTGFYDFPAEMPRSFREFDVVSVRNALLLKDVLIKWTSVKRTANFD
jgi:hypothetical protein